LSIQPAGIGFIETIGAYLLARCYIRDTDDFHNTVTILFRIVLALMPFALIELVTGHNLLREMFAAILPTNFYPPGHRSGLTRVLSVFDHPIQFGLCTGGIVALVYLVLGYQKSFLQRSLRALAVGGTALMSLSAGPIGAVACQGFLLFWNGLLRGIKGRWKILIGLVVCMVLLIEMFANRSALNIIVSFFLFEANSYWYRKLIWIYGTDTVLNHPLLGVGLHDWERPAWMPAESIDSFWLFLAIRSGMPGALLFLIAFFSNFLALSFQKGLDDKTAEYRIGVLSTMTSFFLIGFVGHYWDVAYVLFLFLMGSGVWMLDVETKRVTSREVSLNSPCPGLSGRTDFVRSTQYGVSDPTTLSTLRLRHAGRHKFEKAQ
jgi:hypothetical protein